MGLQGPNLATYKHSNAEALSVPKACTMLSKMVTAIESAHEGGIIHRDIKPVSTQ